MDETELMELCPAEAVPSDDGTKKTLNVMAEKRPRDAADRISSDGEEKKSHDVGEKMSPDGAEKKSPDAAGRKSSDVVEKIMQAESAAQKASHSLSIRRLLENSDKASSDAIEKKVSQPSPNETVKKLMSVATGAACAIKPLPRLNVTLRNVPQKFSARVFEAMGSTTSVADVKDKSSVTSAVSVSDSGTIPSSATEKSAPASAGMINVSNAIPAAIIENTTHRLVNAASHDSSVIRGALPCDSTPNVAGYNTINESLPDTSGTSNDASQTSSEVDYFFELSRRLQCFRESGFLCDAFLVTGNKGIRAHSVLLAAASPVLAVAFQRGGGGDEGGTGGDEGGTGGDEGGTGGDKGATGGDEFGPSEVGGGTIEGMGGAAWTNGSKSSRYVHLPEYDFQTLCVAVHFVYTGTLVVPVEWSGNGQRVLDLKAALKRLGLDERRVERCEVKFQEVNERGNQEMKEKINQGSRIVRKKARNMTAGGVAVASANDLTRAGMYEFTATSADISAINRGQAVLSTYRNSAMVTSNRNEDAVSANEGPGSVVLPRPCFVIERLLRSEEIEKINTRSSLSVERSPLAGEDSGRTSARLAASSFLRAALTGSTPPRAVLNKASKVGSNYSTPKVVLSSASKIGSNRTAKISKDWAARVVPVKQHQMPSSVVDPNILKAKKRFISDAKQLNRIADDPDTSQSTDITDHQYVRRKRGAIDNRDIDESGSGADELSHITSGTESLASDTEMDRSGRLVDEADVDSSNGGSADDQHLTSGHDDDAPTDDTYDQLCVNIKKEIYSADEAALRMSSDLDYDVLMECITRADDSTFEKVMTGIAPSASHPFPPHAGVFSVLQGWSGGKKHRSALKREPDDAGGSISRKRGANIMRSKSSDGGKVKKSKTADVESRAAKSGGKSGEKSAAKLFFNSAARAANLDEKSAAGDSVKSAEAKSGKSKRPRPPQAPRPFKCVGCKSRFVTRVGLAKHECNTGRSVPKKRAENLVKPVRKRKRYVIKKEKVDNSERFRCSICTKLFQSAKDLRRHSTVHTGVAAFACEHCGRAFRERANMRRHELTHSSDRPHLCEHCGRGFTQRPSLVDHVARVHAGGAWPCALCPGPPEARDGDKKLKAEKFSNQRVYAKHCLEVHGVVLPKPDTAPGGDDENALPAPKRALCDECGRDFSGANSLRKHIIRMHGSRLRQPACLACATRFPTRAALREHVKFGGCQNTATKGGVKKEEGGAVLPGCEVCGGRFVSADMLRRHRAEKHGLGEEGREGEGGGGGEGEGEAVEGERVHTCEVCERGFETEKQMKRHRRTHDGPAPEELAGSGVHQCAECSRTYVSAAALRVHAVLHSGAKPYRCFVCERDFAFATSLNVHMRVHNEARPYPCTVCSRRFRQKQAMDRHMLVHTGGYPYACTLCTKSYRGRVDLRSHYTRAHGVSVTKERLNERAVYTIELPPA